MQNKMNIGNNGNRQTITYDGFGNKKRVDYAVGPQTVIGGDIPADDTYTVTSSRIYAGTHIFTDGELEYSGFGGGYFGEDGSPNYYVNDWQGNVAAVLDNYGNTIQTTTYYPYGEPTIEPSGQPYLFGGKERDHAAGRNTYDFGARCLAPYGRWTVVDKEAGKYYSISPYAFCAGDPINFIDPDGNEVKCLSNDEDLKNFANAYPDNGNIILFIHGNQSQMRYDIREKNKVVNQENPLTIQKNTISIL